MIIRNAVLFTMSAAVLALTGCDWGGVHEGESWNDSYSWANFTGNYRVYDMSQISAGDAVIDTGDGQPSSNVTYHKETISLDTIVEATKGTHYDGNLPHTPIVAVQINVGSLGSLTGSSTGALTPSSSNLEGMINCTSGTWSLDIKNPSLANRCAGEKITATYTYALTAAAAAAEKKASSGPLSFSSLNVTQKGNLISIVDSTGTLYSGKITGANVPSNYVAPGSVRLSFEATAASGAKLIGSFTGDWSGAESASTGVLSNRSLRGTYMHNKAKAELTAASADVTVSPYAYAE